MSFDLTSLQNPRVKALVRLNKRREREKRRLTLVEGAREVERALVSGIVPDEAFVCTEIVSDEGRTALAQLETLDSERKTRLYRVSPEVYARIAYRAESGGLLLVIPYLDTSLDRFRMRLPSTGHMVIGLLEGIEKPGNLGAILRSADAAGVHGLIITRTADRPATDLHNPNVARASLGTLFSVPVAEATTADALDWIRVRTVRILAATPDASSVYTAHDLTGDICIALGSEAFGLSRELLAAADEQMRIPMAGLADSLNLSTSAAILFYEAVRQRNR